MALTTQIEAGFQRQLKTGVVFVNLSTAYDTVWRDGLMLKFMRTIHCAKISNQVYSNIIQPIHVEPSSFLKSVPVRRRHRADTLSTKILRVGNPS
jgi:hypothetical protein